jgi:prepilin-type N-terminal cleavage/methylation domain-containing protein
MTIVALGHITRNCSDGERGFTITEILIVTIILGIMFAVSFAILSGILGVSETIESQSDLRGLARSVFHRMNRELQMVSTSGRPLLPDYADCGTTRSQSRNIHLFAPQGATQGGRVLQEIAFIAREAGQHFLEGGGNSGFVQIRYFVREERVDGSYGTSTRKVLVREETPNIRPCESAWEKSMSFPLAEGIEELRFEFFDPENNQWRDSWTEEQEGRVPTMLRYSLTVQNSAAATGDRAARTIRLGSLIALR